MGRELTIEEPLSGKKIVVPVEKDAIPATCLAQFKIHQTTPATGFDTPIRFYDPGFKNTAVCRTSVAEVGEKLLYRGFDVEELVERSSYLEVSFLLIYGHLPNEVPLTLRQPALQEWTRNVMGHTYLHSQMERQMSTFRYDSHPMGSLIAITSSLSTFHPDANPSIVNHGMYMKQKLGDSPTPEQKADNIETERQRNKVIYRSLGKIATIAANVYRHRQGRSYNHPMPHSNSYCENLLYMMDKLDEPNYKPDPRLVKILDKMFILLAENGVNCSTVMMRHLASSGVDPYTALSGASGALFGERKSAAVIDMLKKIGSVENIDKYIDSVKETRLENSKSPKVRLMGFGHRVYKADPRVKICKKLTFEVFFKLNELFDLLGCGELARIALELEKKVERDEWFTSRSLHPNIDFWTGIAFYTFGFPNDMFPVWMVVPRFSGFLAHWVESLDDPEYKIFRPRQVYVGELQRQYEALEPEVEEVQTTIPDIASQQPKRTRPGSLYVPPSYLAESPSYAHDTTLEMDFDSNFSDDGKRSSTDKKKDGPILKWLSKRVSRTAEAEVAILAAEVKELRLKQLELQKQMEHKMEALDHVATRVVEPKVGSSGTPMQSRGIHQRSLSSRTGSMDLLAGSTTARVIAPEK